jgi:TPR repeat protein
MLYEAGEGLTQDLEEAESLFAQAAAKSNVAAMLNLACLYLEV